MRTSDKVFIVSIAVVLSYWIVAITVPGITSPFTGMYYWLTDIALAIGYPGTFIGSFIGNATIVLPFPYIVIIFVQGSVLDPSLVGLIAGTGALAGEMTGYLVGYGGGQLIEEEQTNGFRNFVRKHPTATPLLIWFLALTPLPDDFLIVPLGAAKYAWWKIAIPSLIGKLMMHIGVAWAGFYGMTAVSELLAGGDPESIISKTVEVVALLLVVVAIYLLVRIDWSKVTGGE